MTRVVFNSFFFKQFFFIFLFVLCALIFNGCGGCRRRDRSRGDSQRQPLVRNSDSMTHVIPSSKPTALATVSRRDQFRGLTCSDQSGWKPDWIITCDRIVTETQIVRKNDLSHLDPNYPHLSDSIYESIHLPGMRGEPVEQYELTRIQGGNDVTVFSGTSGSRSAIFKYHSNCRQIHKNLLCGSQASTQADCAVREDEDMLLSEYVLTKVSFDSFSSHRVCPEVYSLSDPVAIPTTLNAKTMVRTIELSQSLCIKLKSSFRLLVEQRVGLTVDNCWQDMDALPTTQLVSFATRAFMRIISLLSQIHSIGILHGDVHSGNIAFREDNEECPFDEPDEVVFIDFGFSKFFPFELGKRDFFGPELYQSANPALLSPFELAGFRRGRRDDIYRAFELYIDIITRGRLRDLYTKVRDIVSFSEMSVLKSRLHITTDRRDPTRAAAILPEKSELIALVNQYEGLTTVTSSWPSMGEFFANMEEYVKGRLGDQPLMSSDSEPDYDWLLKQASSILNEIKT